jgi:transcriptional regulator with XRE-family HTH domain
MENIYKTVGKRAREERRRLKLTQEELAEKADISANFLGHIERGTKRPTLNTLKKIADVLQIPMEALFATEKTYGLPKEDLFIRRFMSLVRDRKREEKELVLKIAKMVLKKPAQK